MNAKFLACWVAAVPMTLIGCAGSAEKKPNRAPMIREVATTSTEQMLGAALNDARRRAGRPALPFSPMLAGLARGESDGAAGSMMLPGNNSNELRDRSGFGMVGKLQGSLKDRGPQTGAGFVEYWSKEEPGVLLGNWSGMGVGISKAADGQLFAIVLLGSSSAGGPLMDPVMSPSGANRR